jgi:ribonuclease P/MRP protein subunit RPP1
MTDTRAGRRGFEAVHAHPDGEATVARLARTAAEYGYEGVVVRNHGDSAAAYDPGAVADAYGVDVVEGIEIRTDDPAQAGGLLGNYRSKRDVVCVHGGPLNRFAVEQPKVDVLAHPMCDGDVNHVLAKAAAENGVHLEFNLARVLRAEGGDRPDALAPRTPVAPGARGARRGGRLRARRRRGRAPRVG